MDSLDPINKQTWYSFQNALVQSVIAGGIESMKYYRRPINDIIVKKENVVGKNPSTLADLYATLAIIQALDNYLTPITTKLFGSYSCLAEETHYEGWFKKKLPETLFKRIKPSSQFFEHPERIRILIDGIDGTGNFIRGIPLFCSAAAILIEDKPRVSALYDPVQNTVYSALLPGPDNNICQDAEAWEWHISSNHRNNLIYLNQINEKKSLLQESIGIHFTRSDPVKLHELIQSDNSLSPLEKLSQASSGIYSFNSSFIAMILVARGALGAYINNTTQLWDIAAGEILVRACEGKVTDFNKKPISYHSPSRVSVVAAKQHIYHDIMELFPRAKIIDCMQK